MNFSTFSSRWTTLDEMNFVRELYERRNTKGLRGWLSCAVVRSWHGDGMAVEPGAVILQAREWLAQLEGLPFVPAQKHPAILPDNQEQQQ